MAEVIGVARDTRYARVQNAPRDAIYLPIFQHVPGVMGYGPTFVVRYQGDTASILRSIRETVAGIDPALTIFNLNTLESYTRESLSAERLMAATSTYIGGFALLLASIGLYGSDDVLGHRAHRGDRPAHGAWFLTRGSPRHGVEKRCGNRTGGRRRRSRCGLLAGGVRARADRRSATDRSARRSRLPRSFCSLSPPARRGCRRGARHASTRSPR